MRSHTGIELKLNRAHKFEVFNQLLKLQLNFFCQNRTIQHNSTVVIPKMNNNNLIVVCQMAQLLVTTIMLISSIIALLQSSIEELNTHLQIITYPNFKLSFMYSLMINDCDNVFIFLYRQQHTFFEKTKQSFFVF